MTEILMAGMTLQDKQLIMYGVSTVTALLGILFITVLILKIKAAQEDKKGEILPSLSDLGIEGEGEEEQLPELDFDENDEDTSSFYEDDELNVDSFLDRN